MSAIYPDLRDGVAVVVGAAGGVGSAVAAEFARQDMTVAVMDLDPTPIASALAGSKRPIHGIALDVTHTEEVHSAFDTIRERCGRLDVLVYTVRWDRRTSLVDLSMEEFDQTIAVHLRALVAVTQASLKSMLPNGSGSLITVSSIQARRSAVGFPAYAAAKAGTEGLFNQIAFEYAPRGIRANVIAPGSILTPAKAELVRQDPGLGLRLAAKLPLGRAVLPADVASLASFLGSSASSMITGQTLVIDAGQTLGLIATEPTAAPTWSGESTHHATR